MVVTEGLSFDILRKDVLTTLQWAEGPTAQKCKTSKRLVTGSSTQKKVGLARHRPIVDGMSLALSATLAPGGM